MGSCLGGWKAIEWMRKLLVSITFRCIGLLELLWAFGNEALIGVDSRLLQILYSYSYLDIKF